MSRLIDADVLLNDMKCLWDWETVDGIQTSTALRQVMTDIRNAPTVGGWVSVEDRLPEKSGYVITFVPFQIDYKIDCMYYNDEYKAFNAQFTPATAIDGVTHWMPLPARPET